MLTAHPQISTAIAAAALALPLTAQESVGDMFGAPTRAQAEQITIEGIFGNNELMPNRVGTIHWLGDGSYTVCEQAKGGNQITRYVPAEDRSEVWVTAAQLTPAGHSEALVVADYQWSNDREKLLLSVRTDGARFTYADPEQLALDHWVWDRAGNRLHQLAKGMGRTAGAGNGEGMDPIAFPKLNADGSLVAYIHNNNIWIEDLARGQMRALTNDGSATLYNGIGDLLYTNEWNFADAFRWSPDGKQIVFLQVDTTEVGEIAIQPSSKELYPQAPTLRFAKAGTQNPKCRVGVIAASGGEPKWMQVPGDGADHYIVDLRWSDGNELLIQQLTRAQTVRKLYRANVADGSCNLVQEEVDEAWIEVGTHFQWNADRSAFTWLSERGGWRQLWSIPGQGEATLLTPDNFDLHSVVRVDDNHAWYLASPENPTQSLLFRTPLTGGPAECLTPQPNGCHQYQLSADGKWAIHRWSTLSTPPRTEVISLPDHKVQRVIEDNQALADALAQANSKHGFFRVETEDNVAMDGWMLMPPEFDQNKMYPVIVYANGEPGTQTAVDRWGGLTHLWHLVLAQRGYVVIGLDNRGSAAPRGREWRRAADGELGVIAAIDQASAVQALCWQNPWMDASRIGIWGRGGGGSTTLTCLFRMPDVFSAGIAVAFTADQHNSSTAFQERHMGMPQHNADAYHRASPIHHALGLSDPLLLIHGTADARRLYQNCARLTDELIRLGKPFDMVAYPGRNHDLDQGPGTSAHMYNTMLRWWLNNLSSESRKPDLMM